MPDEETVDSIAAQDMGGGDVDTSVEEAPPPEGQSETTPPASEPAEGSPEEGQPTDKPDDDDDDDDAADLDETLKAHPAVRRLLNRGRKYRRQIAKYRPHAEVVNSLGGVESLQDIVAKARSYDAIGRSPNVRRLIEGRGEPEPKDQKPATPTEWDDPEFPFDKQDPAGRYLHQSFREFHHTARDLRSEIENVRQENAELKRQIEGIHGGLQRERVTQTQQQWVDKTNRAAADVPDAVRDAFKDLVFGAYQQSLARGVQITPEQAIEHYGKMFKALHGNNAALKAAATQKLAEQAKHMPGKAAFSGGQPATARDKANETLDDIFADQGIYVP